LVTRIIENEIQKPTIKKIKSPDEEMFVLPQSFLLIRAFAGDPYLKR